jgi:hypothetical protein
MLVRFYSFLSILLGVDEQEWPLRNSFSLPNIILTESKSNAIPVNMIDMSIIFLLFLITKALF